MAAKYSKPENHLIVLKNSIEQTADHVMITDKDGIIQYVNPAFERTTGYGEEDALGKNPKILKSGRQTHEYYQRLWDTILAGKNFYAHTINKKKNGEFYIADQTISPVKNESGEITHFISIWKDVTETDRLDGLLKEEKHKLEEIVGFDEKVSSIRKFDKLFDFVVDKTLAILNARKCSIMLIDHHQCELYVKGARGFDQDIFARKVKIGELIAGLVAQEGKPLLVKDIAHESRFRHLAKTSYAGRSFMIVPIMIDGRVIGVINVSEKGKGQDEFFDEIDLRILCAISREVAVSIENLRMYKELHFLTITDSLTHLHNFRHFSKSLDYEIKRTKRSSSPLALMMIDIDHFKSYNDRFGHPDGNKVLKGLAEIFEKNVREMDIVCRYGGDEFGVILPETGREAANIIAERLRRSVQEIMFRQSVTITIGIGMHGKNMNRHELVSRADLALYQAKREGRNRVCIFG